VKTSRFTIYHQQKQVDLIYTNNCIDYPDSDHIDRTEEAKKNFRDQIIMVLRDFDVDLQSISEKGRDLFEFTTRSDIRISEYFPFIEKSDHFYAKMDGENHTAFLLKNRLYKEDFQVKDEEHVLIIVSSVIRDVNIRCKDLKDENNHPEYIRSYKEGIHLYLEKLIEYFNLEDDRVDIKIFLANDN